MCLTTLFALNVSKDILCFFKLGVKKDQTTLKMEPSKKLITASALFE